MQMLANVLTGVVALLHVYFMVLEMVLWRSRAHKVFPVTREFAEQSAGLASNQGLYNGFLVAALLLGLFWPDKGIATSFRLYGLSCVIVAAAWGAITISPRILLVQGVPALLALGAWWMSGRG